jgi:hypothetical protein
MRNFYGESWDDIDQGEPIYYTPAVIPTSPETASQITIDSFNSTATTTASNEYEYDGIIFAPPADEAYEIEIDGIFEGTTLSSNTDSNWWTVRHPMLVVWAALHELEVSYRNKEGAKDWEEQITKRMMLLDFDTVEQDVADIDKIEG